ncbi:MAG: hypothetical protein KGL53_16880, partial [Elusimicrobia bacterium]|nr:hypothetical protein [Elusimicrobiota bacterium]
MRPGRFGAYFLAALFGAAFARPAEAQLAVSVATPSFPADGAAVGVQPNFSWVGPDTSTLAGLGAGASYYLEVSNNDPTFASLAISISTPAVVADTDAFTADAAYVSTFTLSDATTYYWRVRTVQAGVSAPWYSTFTFRADLTAPAASAFSVVSATGGALGEGQFAYATLHSTVQASIQDATS